MAHVEKRPHTAKDGKQTIHWRARYRDPSGRERVKNFQRRVDAERFLVTAEHAKLRGEWTEPRLGKIRFGDYAAEWLTTKADVGPQTLANVQDRLRKHIVSFFGAWPWPRSAPPRCGVGWPGWWRRGWHPPRSRAST